MINDFIRRWKDAALNGDWEYADLDLISGGARCTYRR